MGKRLRLLFTRNVLKFMAGRHFVRSHASKRLIGWCLTASLWGGSFTVPDISRSSDSQLEPPFNYMYINFYVLQHFHRVTSGFNIRRH